MPIEIFYLAVVFGVCIIGFSILKRPLYECMIFAFLALVGVTNTWSKIHMYIFKYNGVLEGDLVVSDEIEKFMWFGIDDDMNLLSNTLKNEVVPYCIQEGLIYNLDINSKKKIK